MLCVVCGCSLGYAVVGLFDGDVAFFARMFVAVYRARCRSLFAAVCKCMWCVAVDVVCCCELLAVSICFMSLFDVVAGCCWCHLV